MRKKPWAKTLLQQTNTPLIHDVVSYKGKWKQSFNKTHCAVEIGAGKGDYWIAMAQKLPDTLWIAIEKDETASAMAIKKAMDISNTNMAWIFKDAAMMDSWFDPLEIDDLYLNFSDPWPKKGHHKRRLSSQHFINLYQQLVKHQVILKTDNKDLFDYSCEMFAQGDWDCISLDLDFRKTLQDDPITAYEQKFMDLNQPIYRANWRKKDAK